MNEKLHTLSLIVLLFTGNMIAVNHDTETSEQETVQVKQSVIEKAKTMLQSKTARTAIAVTKMCVGAPLAVLGAYYHSHLFACSDFHPLVYAGTLGSMLKKTIVGSTIDKSGTICPMSGKVRLRIAARYLTALPLGMYLFLSGKNELAKLSEDKKKN